MQLNLLDITDEPQDLSNKKVLIRLSAGINSAAALVYLGEYHPEHLKPAELHLYYTHLREHSPDSMRFVSDCVRYARQRFPAVKVKITRGSVNKFFEQENMIPHPTISPCSIKLKVKPAEAYMAEHEIDIVMVGFVRTEIKRYERQRKYNDSRARYPILRLTDDDCFSLVDRVIGWHPAIYDIKENGKRVFTHNNCLPCKNMTDKQLASVGKYFPTYAERATATAARIEGGYWGRNDVPDVFKCDACTRFN